MIMFRNKLQPYKDDYIMELLDEAIERWWTTVYPKDETRTIYQDILNEYKEAVDSVSDWDLHSQRSVFVDKYWIETMTKVKERRKVLQSNQ
jgi:hypothetical protein